MNFNGASKHIEIIAIKDQRACLSTLCGLQFHADMRL